MSKRERSSDPLPFLQVDRAAIAVAANLALAMGISKNEAIGALVTFWNICADPRTLEALVAAGVERVVLDEATLLLRLRIAFGRDVDPAMLVELCLLGKEGSGFRVRGMSRQLKAVRGRKTASIKGTVGGQKSAEKRKKQPQVKHRLSTGQAAGKQRLETRDQTSEVKDYTSTQKPERAESIQEETWGFLERARIEHCQALGIDPGIEKRPSPAEINARLSKAVEGETSRLVDGVECTPYDDLMAHHQYRYLQSKFGQFDKDGKPRTPPWPTSLFLSAGVLARIKEQAEKEWAEGVH